MHMYNNFDLAHNQIHMLNLLFDLENKPNMCTLFYNFEYKQIHWYNTFLTFGNEQMHRYMFDILGTNNCEGRTCVCV